MNRRVASLTVGGALVLAAVAATAPTSAGAASCRISKSVNQVTAFSESALLKEIQAGGCMTITYDGPKQVAELTATSTASASRLTKTVKQIVDYSESALLAELRAGGGITVTSGGKTVARIDSTTAPSTTSPTSTSASPTPSATKPTTSSPAPSTSTPKPTTSATTTTPAATTTATTTAPPTGAKLPSQVIDLTNWYLGIPVNTAHDGAPDIIRQPELAGYSDPNWFKVGPTGGVVFSSRADGYTTSGSQYPRSELREMKGSALASWDSAKGTHTLTVRQSIDRADSASKPQIVSAQIHDSSSDLIEVMLAKDGPLVVSYNDGNDRVILDPAYRLGTVFDLKIVADAAGVHVTYNGKTVHLNGVTATGSYFKTGAYLQFGTKNKSGAETDIGQVTIYSATVTHTS